MALGEKAQPEILGDVGILIFIDQHIFEAALIILENIGMGLENAQHFQQQVAEVSGVHDLEPRLIFRIELAANAIGKAVGLARWNLVRQEPTVFPSVDQVGELAGGPALFIHVMQGHHLFEQADLVVRIENGKAGF